MDVANIIPVGLSYGAFAVWRFQANADNKTLEQIAGGNQQSYFGDDIFEMRSDHCQNPTRKFGVRAPWKRTGSGGLIQTYY